jgi:hypothetical protein
VACYFCSFRSAKRKRVQVRRIPSLSVGRSGRAQQEGRQGGVDLVTGKSLDSVWYLGSGGCRRPRGPIAVAGDTGGRRNRNTAHSRETTSQTVQHLSTRPCRHSPPLVDASLKPRNGRAKPPRPSCPDRMTHTTQHQHCRSLEMTPRSRSVSRSPVLSSNLAEPTTTQGTFRLTSPAASSRCAPS